MDNKSWIITALMISIMVIAIYCITLIKDNDALRTCNMVLMAANDHYNTFLAERERQEKILLDCYGQQDRILKAMQKREK